MKIYERLKNNYFNKEYYISFNNNDIYIINYKKIIIFESNLIKIKFNNFDLKITGKDFKLSRKTNLELEIKGSFSKMEIINE